MRYVTLPRYLAAILLAVGVVSPVASGVVSVVLSNRTLHAAEQRSARARAEQIVITCNTFAALIAATEETPPTTAAGRNVQRAYREQYNALGCSHRK